MASKPEDDCKELEPFAFDGEDASGRGVGIGGGGDSSGQSGGAGDSGMMDDEELSSASGWNAEDMIAINEAKYGYKSTFNVDMNEYTVAVEKTDSEEYRRREEEADRLAQEIESDSNYKRNIDKELSDGEDEEEAFSAVVRGDSSGHHHQADHVNKSSNYNQQHGGGYHNRQGGNNNNASDSYYNSRSGDKQGFNRRSLNKPTTAGPNSSSSTGPQGNMMPRTLSGGANTMSGYSSGPGGNKQRYGTNTSGKIMERQQSLVGPNSSNNQNTGFRRM